MLKQLQDNPEMWMRVDTILETSSNPNTKFFALQVRMGARWDSTQCLRACRLEQPDAERDKLRAARGRWAGAKGTTNAAPLPEALRSRAGARESHQVQMGLHSCGAARGNQELHIWERHQGALYVNANRLTLHRLHPSSALRARLPRSRARFEPSIPFFFRCPPTRCLSGETERT